jgi:hypothetical protein
MIKTSLLDQPVLRFYMCYDTLQITLAEGFKDPYPAESRIAGLN